MFEETVKRLTTALCLSALAACGGGGGGGGPPAPTLAITAANAPDVVEAAYRAAPGVEIGIFGAESPGAPGLAVQSLPRFLRNALVPHAARSSAVMPHGTEACDSGSVDVPADPNGFGTYTFISCRLGSITLNGVITISGTGDFTGDTFNGSLSFSNLSVSDSGIQTATLNGTINFIWTTSGTVESGSQSGNYSVSSGGDSLSVSGYSSTYQYDEATNEETSSIRYTLTSSSLGGTISVATTETIVWLDVEIYPRGGQLVITGANSAVRVTIQGSGAPSGVVLIEVDADGDGNYETSENRTWSQLIS